MPNRIVSRTTENRRIASEFQRLVEQGTLGRSQMHQIAERYPLGRWQIISLIWAGVSAAGFSFCKQRSSNSPQKIRGSG